MRKQRKLFQAKRILAILLAVALCVPSFLPMTVKASDTIGTEVSDGITAGTDEATDEEAGTVTDSEPVIAAEETLKTEIKANFTKEDTTAVYNGTELFNDENFYIKCFTSIQVFVDGVEIQDVSSNLRYLWKKVNGENEELVEGSPVDVGDYYFYIILDAKKDCYNEAYQKVAFTVEKATLQPNATPIAVDAGTKAKDVSVANVYVKTLNGDVINYIPDDATTPDVDESEESPISYTLKVKEAISGKELDPDSSLMKGSDYIVEVDAAFTDKAPESVKSNYELVPASFDVTIGSLVSTYIKIEKTDKWGEKISKVYDQKELSLVKDVDYTVKVFRADTKEEIPNAEINMIWMNEEAEVMDSAPVDAGSYYYVASYTPADGIYAESMKALSVKIEPLTLVIKPVIQSGAMFYPEQSAEDVLTWVDYQVLDKDRNDITERIKENRIFGIFNQGLALEPLFEVCEVTTTIKNETQVVNYDPLDSDDTLEKDKSYCIRFTGGTQTRGLYGEPETTYIGINESIDANYIVDDTSETRDAFVAAITVADDITAIIDVSAILKNGKGDSYENPIVSSYTTYYLPDCKKAVVKEKASGNVLAKDTDHSIYYKWYRQTNVGSEPPIWQRFYGKPSEVGIYKLVISYRDGQDSHYAKPVEVFFRIDKQEARMIPGQKQTFNMPVGFKISDCTSGMNPDLEVVIKNSDETDGDKIDKNRYHFECYAESYSEEDDTWSRVSDDAVFATGVKYRVKATLVSDSYFAEEIVAPVEFIVIETGDMELNVIVDENALDSKTKVYDGEEFDISDALSNNLIRLMTIEEDPQEVNPEMLGVKGFWVNSEGEECKPVNVGEYTYCIYYPGDKKYKPIAKEVVTIHITKRPLVIEPVLKEPIVAGSMDDTLLSVATIDELTGYFVNYPETMFYGVAPKDKEAFTYKKFYDKNNDCYQVGFEAVNYYEVSEGNYLPALIFFAFDKNGNQVEDALIAGEEYTIDILPVGMYLAEEYAQNYNSVIKRKSFTVVHGNSKVDASILVKDSINGMTHTITPKEGIPYSQSVTNNATGEVLKGNFITVSIKMPSEYLTIPAALLYENSIKKAGGFNIARNGNIISATFDVSGKEKKEFDIRWEMDYSEHFILDCTDAYLLADLSKAVVPKSLAFNSPLTKMSVGQEQNLDVKLTKVQESDIIRLVYSVDNKEILHVEEDGTVIALAKGSATVTVAPAKLVNGKLVEIEGAKTAKVKITVTDVQAPKITNIYPGCDYIEYGFSYVESGHYYVAYLLEGKKTVKDCETAISSMKNGNWIGIFAAEPDYVDKTEARSGFGELKSDTQYTLYLRNVTYPFVLDDGCMISQSHAGVVKTFKTTKMDFEDVRLLFSDENAVFSNINHYYSLTLPLSKGKTSVSTEVLCCDDEGKYVWEKLPLSKEMQKKYRSVKLNYFIYELDTNERESESDFGSFWDDETNQEYYMYNTKLASVDKKGNVKVKNAGEYVIFSFDTSGDFLGIARLTVTATADSVAGKNVKLKAGQSMDLSDMLVYKEGKNVLSGSSFDKKVVVDEQLRNAFAENESFKLVGTSVTAVKPGKISFTLKDAFVDQTATVTITASAMDPVKNLKTTKVTDQLIELEFAHSGYADGFRIMVTNASGNIIENQYLKKSRIYKASTGKYYYQIVGLTPQSKYNISVTACIDSTQSKEVKKSVTTTKTPISYVSLSANQVGGVKIDLPNTTDVYTINEVQLVSGNTYSLRLDGNKLNYGAIYAETDSAIWSSTNKKVATVQSAKGSIYATLKALKAGQTTIEVKSKVTKAVIARYVITINPVGDAYSYYGNNEELKKNEQSNDGIESLSLGSGTAVTTEEGKYVWLKFTAPSSGQYRFYSTGSQDSKVWIFKNMDVGDSASNDTLNNVADQDGYGYDDDGGDGSNFSKEVSLEAGEVVYLAVGYYNLGSALTNTTVYVTMLR